MGLEQIEIAQGKLVGNGDGAAAIHDARRCLKRLRALLRLTRPALKESVYRAEAERLVGIGRLLADARDAHVLQQTLGKLEARFGALPNGGAARLRKLLDDRQAGNGAASPTDQRRQAQQRLVQARKLFTGKGLGKVELSHVIDGLERAYAKARKTFHNAFKEPSDEAFHAWRKTVQVHWRHTLLFSRGWPETLSARAGEAKELSRLLGEDHDYSLLLAFARDHAAPALPPKALASLAAACRSCQSDLRAQAHLRGERLFAEAADDLTERMTLYWKSARRLAELPTPADGKSAGKLAAAKSTKSRSKIRALAAVEKPRPVAAVGQDAGDAGKDGEKAKRG